MGDNPCSPLQSLLPSINITKQPQQYTIIHGQSQARLKRLQRKAQSTATQIFSVMGLMAQLSIGNLQWSDVSRQRKKPTGLVFVQVMQSDPITGGGGGGSVSPSHGGGGGAKVLIEERMHKHIAKKKIWPKEATNPLAGGDGTFRFIHSFIHSFVTA